MKRSPPSVGTWRSSATNAVFPEDKLAEGANLGRTYLSGIERGVRNPGIKVVIKLSRVLNVSMVEPRGGDGKAEESSAIDGRS